jgi:Folate-sensitive fragile site protein Fra10Ac1
MSMVGSGSGASSRPRPRPRPTPVGRRAVIPLIEGTGRGATAAPGSTIGSVDGVPAAVGLGVPVRGGMFGKVGVPIYCARRPRRSGVPVADTLYGVPDGLPREPGPLRLLGVPKAGRGVERGLTMLTGRVGLDMNEMGWGCDSFSQVQLLFRHSVLGNLFIVIIQTHVMSSSFSTEFDILKASHKFLREDQDAVSEPDRNRSWNDQVAQKYYDTLFREFAVCDLKHYKSGNVTIHLLSFPSSLYLSFP